MEVDLVTSCDGGGRVPAGDASLGGGRPRGTCPVCGGAYRLRADGRIRGHMAPAPSRTATAAPAKPRKLFLVRSPNTGRYRWEERHYNGHPVKVDGEPVVGGWYVMKASMLANLRKVYPQWWRMTLVDRTATWEKPKGAKDASRAATDTPPLGYGKSLTQSARRL